MTDKSTKSLSVNYGSFSITIEGFEDPFALMKRVTDYFQRVAARDPQFGARPLDQDVQVFENLSDILASEEIEVVPLGIVLGWTGEVDYYDHRWSGFYRSNRCILKGYANHNRYVPYFTHKCEVNAGSEHHSRFFSTWSYVSLSRAV